MADAGVVTDKEEKEFADYKGITSGCDICRNSTLILLTVRT